MHEREHEPAGTPGTSAGRRQRPEPELPPPTAGTPPPATAEPAYRLSAAWPYVGAVFGGVALVLILGLVFVAKPLATSAKAQSAPPSDDPAGNAAAGNGKKAKGGGFLTPRKQAQAELPRTKTAVLVLNGSGTSGAAGEAAARLESQKYRIVGVSDAAHPDYHRTLVLYRSGFKGEAERLARDLGLSWKRVAPLDGMKRRQVGEARVVLILGG